jgi:hypothetical protein
VTATPVPEAQVAELRRLVRRLREALALGSGRTVAAAARELADGVDDLCRPYAPDREGS